ERRQWRAYARTGVDPLAGDEPAVDERLDAAAAARGLAAALGAMSARDREVLLLYAWAELGYQEIASALGIPVGTVRSRMNRAAGAGGGSGCASAPQLARDRTMGTLGSEVFGLVPDGVSQVVLSFPGGPVSIPARHNFWRARLPPNPGAGRVAGRPR